MSKCPYAYLLEKVANEIADGPVSRIFFFHSSEANNSSQPSVLLE